MRSPHSIPGHAPAWWRPRARRSSGWWDPRVLAAARPEITPERLLEGAGSLYLVAPTHEQDRLRNIYAAIVQEMTRAVYTHRARTGTPLDPALLVVLDEAAHIAPVRELGALAATGPEPGIQLVTIFHDHAQIHAIYGAQAASVIANHRARLILPGVGDPETLERISRSLGSVRRRHASRTTGRLGTSVTDSHVAEPLIAAHALRELRSGWGLLVYGSRPPVRLRLRLWFDDRALRGIAGGGGLRDVRLQPMTRAGIPTHHRGDTDDGVTTRVCANTHARYGNSPDCERQQRRVDLER